MKKISIKFMALLTASFVIMMAVPLIASAAKVKKIDNFIVFVDQSGSMAQKHAKLKQKKIDLAVDIVKRLDSAIPELDYKGSIVLFAPVQTVSAPSPYKNGALTSAISGVDTKFYVFGRETPFGDGLQAVDATLAGLSGKTALIVLTDGHNNLGSDPVAQARALYSKYGSNLCIHIINMDTDPKGTAIIDEIRAQNGCTVSADAMSLANDATLGSFAQEVFFKEEDPCARDSDGDGVPDCRDKCPDTIPGAIVDEDGCALKHTMQIEFDFDKAEVRPEYHDKIAEAAEFVKRYPKTQILVAGHTDSTGEADYNKELSMKRAESLMIYMVENFGVQGDQLHPRGYGESRPIASNDTEEGRQANRRVEFICCTIIPPK
ncbi:MAG: OmpA family protein [Deltaproteobacteria bacterium]|jgi:OOP family OmpA-OmpF porin|nr:OmpA family protein [Deltaproteobacteria bacterium]MBW2504689.1 OmpA family protein [Deltaproteobacteria bacterium]MBW2519189.1 OmpA family protein [Deltaproteobacteria bacterium]